MLRDYEVTFDDNLVLSILRQFRVGIEQVHTLDFEALSPDSFVWKLGTKNSIYYLYAEDYVESIEAITKAIRMFSGDEVKLIEVKSKISFENAAPVKNAEIYKKPESYEKISKYAVVSGYDFVFLAQAIKIAKMRIAS